MIPAGPHRLSSILDGVGDEDLEELAAALASAADAFRTEPKELVPLMAQSLRRMATVERLKETHDVRTVRRRRGR